MFRFGSDDAYPIPATITLQGVPTGRPISERLRVYVEIGFGRVGAKTASSTTGPDRTNWASSSGPEYDPLPVPFHSRNELLPKATAVSVGAWVSGTQRLLFETPVAAPASATPPEVASTESRYSGVNGT